MDEVECVVIGAGIVGLAIARSLALSGREVLVVEKERTIGAHTSSRNSEVIHAGIYYPQHSLMARLCVEGRMALYDYCDARDVPYSRCGKLIVATDAADALKLQEIAQRAARNGVDDLSLLSGGEAIALEPQLSCTAALLSPSTGIVDSHTLMLAFQADAEAAGAMIAFGCPFVGAISDGSDLVLSLGGAEPTSIRARHLVNSAGLFAPEVARTIEGIAPDRIPTAYFARGVYFVLSGRCPFSRLVYPVPVAGGLGIHLTIDLGGQARFGPDVEWINSIDYYLDETRLPRFAEAVRRYWPGLEEARLLPGYTGIRPKIVPPGAPGQDFAVEDSEVHGIAGLINLFGIESPGLTASLALADHVRQLVETHTR
ncbi:NAD(P)/FAD-dependent oxidoreductase [Mesorhizobium sp. WSM2239]|uniref:NAD(P)/FAD-dependent oxidoreductase n=2 Tax=unclassified Mesorhizobium TaxID=325217 RepID=A0AAU8DIW9_9HYPH